LAAGANFRTIADFRKLHLATLAGLFEEVLKIALEAGALKLGRVALNGTKVQANARRGDELPAELQRRETRPKKIREAQRALEERARQSAEQAVPARTVTPQCDAGRPHEAQASDRGGAGSLCGTENDRGAGLRPDQRGPRVSPLPLARLG